MTIDPAFGLLLCGPIVIAAVAAVVIARLRARTVAILSVCAAIAFAAGCMKPPKLAGQSGTATTIATATAVAATAVAVAATPAAPASASAAPAVTIAPLTAEQLQAALHPTPGGDVSVDVFDTRSNGQPNPGGLTMGLGDTLYVVGWAYLGSKSAACHSIALLVDGKSVLSGAYGYPRTDVASFYKDPRRTNVGYAIAVSGSRLGSGKHRATVVCVVAGDTARTDGTVRSITVR